MTKLGKHKQQERLLGMAPGFLSPRHLIININIISSLIRDPFNRIRAQKTLRLRWSDGDLTNIHPPEIRVPREG